MTFSLDTLYTQSVASSRAQCEGLHAAPPAPHDGFAYWGAGTRDEAVRHRKRVDKRAQGRAQKGRSTRFI